MRIQEAGDSPTSVIDLLERTARVPSAIPSSPATTASTSTSTSSQAFFGSRNSTITTNSQTQAVVPGAAQHAVVYSQPTPHVPANSTLTTSTTPPSSSTAPMSPTGRFSVTFQQPLPAAQPSRQRDSASPDTSYLFFLSDSQQQHQLTTDKKEPAAAAVAASCATSASTAASMAPPPFSPITAPKLAGRFSPFLPNPMDEQAGNFDDVYNWLHEPIGLDGPAGFEPKPKRSKVDFDDAIDFESVTDETDHLNSFMWETLEVA